MFSRLAVMLRANTPFQPENTDFLCSNLLTDEDVVGHGFDLPPWPPSLPGKGETPLCEGRGRCSCFPPLWGVCGGS